MSGHARAYVPGGLGACHVGFQPRGPVKTFLPLGPGLTCYTTGSALVYVECLRGPDNNHCHLKTVLLTIHTL